MSKRPFVIFGLFAVLCVLVLPFWALGKEGDEDAATVDVAATDEDGKSIFATNCGTCHQLAAAGTDGVVGPNLDDLLVPTGANSAEQFEAIYQRVLSAVSCGIEGRMPKEILIGEEAQEAAAFAAAYAGQIDKGPTVDTATVETPEPGPCAAPPG
ncbi:MAG: c-type cytochrome [Solirubrobacterales bacterium]